MKVKDIKSKLIRELAESYYDEEFESEHDKDYLMHSFGWDGSKEGYVFWDDVNEGLSEQELIEKHPDLEIWGNCDNVVTDNSQVNENLLKENEELKDKLKDIEAYFNAYSQLEGADEFYTDGYAKFFGPTPKDKAKELLSQQDEEVKKAMFEILKNTLNQEK